MDLLKWTATDISKRDPPPKKRNKKKENEGYDSWFPRVDEMGRVYINKNGKMYRMFSKTERKASR